MYLHDQRRVLNYYAQGDRFPYPQGNGGPFEIFICRPNLDNPPFPVSQPGAICAAGSGTMNFFRPNQALVRGVIRGGATQMSGLGDSSVSMPLLIGGLGVALLAGWMALGPRRRLAI